MYVAYRNANKRQDYICQTVNSLRFHRHHIRVHNYPQSNSVRHFEEAGLYMSDCKYPLFSPMSHQSTQLPTIQQCPTF